jgi:hypothetical protein
MIQIKQRSSFIYLQMADTELHLNVRQTDFSTRVEAGSNTSTVNLRVVRGDEMGLKKKAAP